MHDDRYNFVSALLVPTHRVLLGADSTHDNWVDSLQVGWVRQKCDCHVLFIAVGQGLQSRVRCAQVILDITCVVKLLSEVSHCCRLDTLDLGHDDFEGFSDHICQQVQSTTMWHTDHEKLRAIHNSGINHNLQARDK